MKIKLKTDLKGMQLYKMREKVIKEATSPHTWHFKEFNGK